MSKLTLRTVFAMTLGAAVVLIAPGAAYANASAPSCVKLEPKSYWSSKVTVDNNCRTYENVTADVRLAPDPDCKNIAPFSKGTLDLGVWGPGATIDGIVLC